MEATVELPGEVATAPVCEALGLSRAVVYRRRNPAEAKVKRPRPRPDRALDPHERQEVLDTLHAKRLSCTSTPAVSSTTPSGHVPGSYANRFAINPSALTAAA